MPAQIAPPGESQPVNCYRWQTLRLPDVSVSVNTVQSKNNEAGTIYRHRFGSFLGYQLTGGELGARWNYGDACNNSELACHPTTPSAADAPAPQTAFANTFFNRACADALIWHTRAAPTPSTCPISSRFNSST